MRSWIFVIGAAAMGVASIIGCQFAMARAYRCVELIAETPSIYQAAPLSNEKKEKTEKRESDCYARADSAFPPDLRCAACHGGAKRDSRAPLYRPAASAAPQTFCAN